MDFDTRFKINAPKVIHETIDGEAIILNLDSGNYYSMDRAGNDIWGLIVKGANAGSIIEWVDKHYDTNGADVSNVLPQLIDQLIDEGIIIPDQENSAVSITETDVPYASEHTERMSFVMPVLNKYSDMEELLLLDPIHEVDEMGWPNIQEEKT